MDFERIMYIRQMLDLSQREIAKKLNVSKSTYARWETGEKIIPLNHLVNLCNLIKLPIDYALGLSSDKNYINYKITVNKNTISKNLTTIRKKLNLTQKDLAKILSTSQSTISAYESGKTLILTAFLYQIAKEYNVSVDLLCYGKYE